MSEPASTSGAAPEYSQSALSREIGLSLDKTRHLLRALLNVRRRLQITMSFLQRKEAEYESRRGQVVQLRQKLSARLKAEPRGVAGSIGRKGIPVTGRAPDRNRQTGKCLVYELPDPQSLYRL